MARRKTPPKKAPKAPSVIYLVKREEGEVRAVFHAVAGVIDYLSNVDPSDYEVQCLTPDTNTFMEILDTYSNFKVPGMSFYGLFSGKACN